MKRLFFSLAILFVALAPLRAQPAVPAQPAMPNQARPAVPVAPDSITPPQDATPSANSAPASTTSDTNAASTSSAPQIVLTIIADSSLKQVLAALAQAWADAQDSGPQVPLTLTNAGTMRGKIEAPGSTYDVVIDADLADVKALTQEGLLSADGQRSLARNSLVVYGRKALLKDDDLDWYDLVGSEWKKVALGEPELVASGRVATRALKLHDLLDDDHKDIYVYAPTDALAAAVVQRDAADAVFLFKTDAARMNVPGFEAVPLPTTDAPPVFYTASVGRTAKNPDMARSFLEYCSGSDAKAIWEKFGFETD